MAAVYGEVTTAELARRLDALEVRINDQFERTRTTVENLQYVTRDVYEVRHQALIERVESLEEAKKWTIRTFVMAFIFPVLAAVLVALTFSQ